MIYCRLFSFILHWVLQNSPHLRISLPAKWRGEVHIPPLGLADVVSGGIDLGCHVQHINTIFCDHLEKRRTETVNVHPPTATCLVRFSVSAVRQSGERVMGALWWSTTTFLLPLREVDGARATSKLQNPPQQLCYNHRNSCHGTLAPNYSIINTSCPDQTTPLFII